MDALVHLRTKTEAGGRGEETTEEPALATSLGGVLYADHARVVSKSPEQLRKMMKGVGVVCAAFGITISENKTKILCLHTKGVPESAVIFRVETAVQVCDQTNKC